MTKEVVDVDAARAHLIDALRRLDSLQGRTYNPDQSSSNAEIAKELLFIDHLLSKTKVLVLDTYHAGRGFHGPERVTETRTYSVTVTPTEEISSERLATP